MPFCFLVVYSFLSLIAGQRFSVTSYFLCGRTLPLFSSISLILSIYLIRSSVSYLFLDVNHIKTSISCSFQCVNVSHFIFWGKKIHVCHKGNLPKYKSFITEWAHFYKLVLAFRFTASSIYLDSLITSEQYVKLSSFSLGKITS